MLTQQDITQFFSKTFLFADIPAEQAARIISEMQCTVMRYGKGDTLCTPESYERRIGFVFSGECEVASAGIDGGVPLNSIKQFGSFGISSVFSDKDEFPTEITAKKESVIIYIDKSVLTLSLTKHPEIALNTIRFLTERVEFLNRKISTFSIGDCGGKVASLILQKHEQSNSEIVVFNCKSAAEHLNIGRASLYRALRSLCEKGLIEHENKKIIIKDPEGLKGISK